jgi:hypothetical protein
VTSVKIPRDKPVASSTYGHSDADRPSGHINR